MVSEKEDCKQKGDWGMLLRDTGKKMKEEGLDWGREKIGVRKGT